MKSIFIYNPHSGKHKSQKKLNYLINGLRNHFHEIDIVVTTSFEDTISKAKDACGKYDHLIFAGGDGTFNNILNGIGECHNKPILGYIPFGTINDLARNLDIPRNYKKALQTIINGKIKEFDYGKLNNQYFGYVSAIGSFTNISYRTKQGLKSVIGRFGYYIYGIKEIFKLRYINVKITIDGEVFEERTPLILILNSRNVGGFRINRASVCDDGKFDVFIVKPGFMKGLFNFVRFFIFKRGKKIIHRHAKNIVAEIPDNVVWCIDGESGDTGNASIKVCDDKIKIYSINKQRKSAKTKKYAKK